MVLVPEKPIDIDHVCALLKYNYDHGKHYGVVVVADPRVVTKPYGRRLLEGLPPARRIVGRWSDLLPQLQSFYDAART